jgi:hypothetical protein
MSVMIDLQFLISLVSRFCDIFETVLDERDVEARDVLLMIPQVAIRRMTPVESFSDSNAAWSDSRKAAVRQVTAQAL